MNVRTTGRRAGGRGWGACPWRPGAGWREARRRSGTTAPPAGGTPVLMRPQCPGGCTKYTIHYIRDLVINDSVCRDDRAGIDVMSIKWF